MPACPLVDRRLPTGFREFFEEEKKVVICTYLIVTCELTASYPRERGVKGRKLPRLKVVRHASETVSLACFAWTLGGRGRAIRNASTMSVPCHLCGPSTERFRAALKETVVERVSGAVPRCAHRYASPT